MLIPREGRYGIPLDLFVGMVGRIRMIHRNDLREGDVLEVRTRNSRYTIRVLEDERYRVSGGWFEQRHAGPVEVPIKGCTWGGSTIKVDVIAACGLCIEFGNKVITSAVERIVLLRHESGN